MEKQFFQNFLAVLLITSVSFFPAFADEPTNQDRKTVSDCDIEGRTFSVGSGAIVLKAQEFMSENDYLDALKELEIAAALLNLNAFEKAVIYQMQGSVFYELDQYANAVAAFDLALASGGLCPDEYKNLRKNIAQLLIADGRYEQGALMLETLFAEDPNMDKKFEVMIFQAWIQAEQYSRALPWAERWFNAASPKQRKHFDVLNFLYHNLGMTEKQADIVQQMINRWPEDKSLWDMRAKLLAK